MHGPSLQAGEDTRAAALQGGAGDLGLGGSQSADPQRDTLRPAGRGLGMSRLGLSWEQGTTGWRVGRGSEGYRGSGEKQTALGD